MLHSARPAFAAQRSVAVAVGRGFTIGVLEVCALRARTRRRPDRSIGFRVDFESVLALHRTTSNRHDILRGFAASLLENPEPRVAFQRAKGLAGVRHDRQRRTGWSPTRDYPAGNEFLSFLNLKPSPRPFRRVLRAQALELSPNIAMMYATAHA